VSINNLKYSIPGPSEEEKMSLRSLLFKTILLEIERKSMTVILFKLKNAAP